MTLTFQQKKEVQSRFTYEPNYGNWDPISATFHNRYVIAHCKLCPATAEKIPGHKTCKSTWQYKKEGDIYFRRTYSGVSPDIELLHEHLVTQHKVTPCSVCNQLVTTRGLTRHQKSPVCQSELRRFHMREVGFSILEEPLLRMINTAIDHKARDIEKAVDWRDWETMRSLQRSKEDAQFWFWEKLGVAPAYTKWQPDQKAYDKEFWAPPEVTMLLDLLSDVLAHDAHEERLHTLTQWLDGTQEIKESILAILELRKDSTS